MLGQGLFFLVLQPAQPCSVGCNPMLLAGAIIMERAPLFLAPSLSIEYFLMIKSSLLCVGRYWASSASRAIAMLTSENQLLVPCKVSTTVFECWDAHKRTPWSVDASGGGRLEHAMYMCRCCSAAEI
jgi:hypothetical protein